MNYDTWDHNLLLLEMVIDIIIVSDMDHIAKVPQISTFNFFILVFGRVSLSKAFLLLLFFISLYYIKKLKNHLHLLS